MSNTATLSVALKAQATITVTEAGEFVNTGNSDFVIDGMDLSATLNATTTPAVTKKSVARTPLVTSALTLDLTAMPGDSADETVNMTGLKVQVLKLKNPSTNANKLVFSNGASNPYRIDGATTAWSIPLAPGQEIMLYGDAASDAVASGHKTIDVAGTGSQDVEYEVIAG